MNLLLLSPQEVGPDGIATLDDRRARHLLDVLDTAPGRELRCGLLDGPLGTATVVAVRDRTVALACSFEAERPPRPRDVLLLAVPRPKVLRRVIEDATALGYGRIVLFRSWRVDKSHLQSQALAPEALRTHAIAGLEQSRRTHLPAIVVEPLFKPFVEDRLGELVESKERFVADPDAAMPTSAVRPRGPIALAVGPERGFTGYEVGKLSDAGFTPVGAGAHPLRVETAIAVVTAQLKLARELTTGIVDDPR